MNKFGIQNLIEAIIFFAAFGRTVADVAADKKFEFGEFAKFFNALSKLRPAVDGYDEIPQELGDLTEEENEQLVTVLEDELQIENEAARELISLGFDSMLTFVRFAAQIKVYRDQRMAA